MLVKVEGVDKEKEMDWDKSPFESIVSQLPEFQNAALLKVDDYRTIALLTKNKMPWMSL